MAARVPLLRVNRNAHVPIFFKDEIALPKVPRCNQAALTLLIRFQRVAHLHVLEIPFNVMPQMVAHFARRRKRHRVSPQKRIAQTQGFALGFVTTPVRTLALTTPIIINALHLTLSNNGPICTPNTNIELHASCRNDTRRPFAKPIIQLWDAVADGVGKAREQEVSGRLLLLQHVAVRDLVESQDNRRNHVERTKGRSTVSGRKE